MLDSITKKEDREEYINLLLLAGEGVPINSEISFRMPTLKEIAQVGEKHFLELSGLIAMNYEVVRKGMLDQLDTKEKVLIKTLQSLSEAGIILQVVALNKEMQDKWNQFFNLFLSERIGYDRANYFFYSKKTFKPLSIEELDIILESSRVAFEITQKDLDKQLESEQGTAANERARKLQEKINRNKKRVAKYKDESNLFKLILGVSEQSRNINLQDIWELSYFQFRMLTQQTLKKESYDRLIRMRDSGNFDLKGVKEPPHWTI